jgi:glycerol-3-phosphate acyltransferase PlsX
VPRIAIDAMGGDRAPEEIVRGAALASLAAGDLELILVGDTARIGRVLAEVRYDAEHLRIHHASEVIHAGERAAEALAARPDASIHVAAELARQREADAVITAGPASAALLACTPRFRRLAGVAAPALAAVYPTEMRRGEKDDPFALILDVGARLDASAADLTAYALMGAAYASQISKNPRPRVALLGAGDASPGSGPRVVDEAHDLILRHTGLNFIGRIAATDIPHGIADVVVCGGYTGHMVVALLEGVGDTMLALARYAYKERLLWRAALGMLSGGIGRLKRLTDWAEYGGAPLLGYEQLLVRVHPTSGERAVANAIKVCAKAAAGELGREIQRRMADLEAKLPTRA